MADINISIGGTSAAFSLSDADAGRILAAYTALFTTQGEDGVPVIPDTQTCVMMIAKGVVAGLAQNAIRYEQEQAAKAAAEAVPTIDATLLTSGT